MEDLNIRVVDEDHIWINGYQFIRLGRVGKMLEEQKREILRWQGVSTEPVCHFCGGKLSEIRYDGDKKYRHCYSCHFDEYEL